MPRSPRCGPIRGGLEDHREPVQPHVVPLRDRHRVPVEPGVGPKLRRPGEQGPDHPSLALPHRHPEDPAVIRTVITAFLGSATRAITCSQPERSSRFNIAPSAYSCVNVNSDAATGSISRLVKILYVTPIEAVIASSRTIGSGSAPG